MTKVKSDHCGLYVLAGGYISRPFAGTCFKEGDKVKTHHFGGSVHAGVGIEDVNFRKKETFEYWTTIGCSSKKYEKELKDPYDGSLCPI